MPQLKISIFKIHKYCKNIKTTTQSNANYPLKKKTTKKKIKPHGKIYKHDPNQDIWTLNTELLGTDYDT
ncbi:hypothetical protein FLA4_11970 [Candidatus Rickettsia kotlanii]|nr:hypothetical protein FLA4_11970 [Candidatus Rickettsia kotlanii]BDU62029.1 hypothetical protein HM2_11970 [Candidatus Rickettsia kotlanii]